MIFIQSAPSGKNIDKYIIWQLYVQAANLREYGEEENMVVLFGLEPGTKEPDEETKKFEAWFKGKVYYYPDTRVSRHYRSSIRPHLIAKYLKDHPTDCFYYSDQDTIHLEKPEWDKYKDTPYHYVAPSAKSYMDSIYLRRFTESLPKGQRGKNIFPEICKLIGIEEELYIKNDEHCGGAHYIIKGTDYKFWEKCEKDCEAVYKYLADASREDSKNKVYAVQKWATDLWVLFANLLLTGKEVRHLKEIDFIWPYYTFKDAKEKGVKIIHNAGVTRSNHQHIFFDVYDTQTKEKVAVRVRKQDFKPIKGKEYEFKEVDKKPKHFYKDLYRHKYPWEDNHFYVTSDKLQHKYISYFDQFKTNKPLKKLLVLFNTTHGRKVKKIHPDLLKASLSHLKKAVDNTKLAEVEVITTTWEAIPDNPFKELISPFQNMGHLNYLLQMKLALVNSRPSDIVVIIEHDVLTSENYLNEIVQNWDYGKYGQNNRNYIGINKTGYLNVIPRNHHHPMSMMSFATFYFKDLLNKKIDGCLKSIAPGKPYGLVCVEPDNKKEMAEFWSSIPCIHVSGEGLGEYSHNYTSHNTVCYERDSNGKVHRDDWGNYLELLPFLTQHKN